MIARRRGARLHEGRDGADLAVHGAARVLAAAAALPDAPDAARSLAALAAQALAVELLLETVW